jgi:hypothetical protein
MIATKQWKGQREGVVFVLPFGYVLYHPKTAPDKKLKRSEKIRSVSAAALPVA